jgi:peptidoglycan-N-acetylglucosamine deacetylase
VLTRTAGFRPGARGNHASMFVAQILTCPAVTLSFDDGPDPIWTPRVLAELDRLDVRAAFFVIADRAAGCADLVREMHAEGHHIGLHCKAHVRHTCSTDNAIRRDTQAALEVLGDIGIEVTRWRTPWGDCAEWTPAIARENGLVLTGWTADTHDWRGDDAPRMLAAVKNDLGDGSVVLMHDGLGPGARRDDCRETVRLIEPLCALIRDHGGEVAPLPDVLEPA